MQVIFLSKLPKKLYAICQKKWQLNKLSLLLRKKKHTVKVWEVEEKKNQKKLKNGESE